MFLCPNKLEKTMSIRQGKLLWEQFRKASPISKQAAQQDKDDNMPAHMMREREQALQEVKE